MGRVVFQITTTPDLHKRVKLALLLRDKGETISSVGNALFTKWVEEAEAELARESEKGSASEGVSHDEHG